MTSFEPLFLEAAAILLTAAVAGIDEEHPHLVVSPNNLCAAHQHRYLRFGDPAELNWAVEVGERGVAVSTAGDPNRTMCLSNLGTAYLYRFPRTAVAADLHRAVELGERAVAGEDDPRLGNYLVNLCQAYLETDLDRAVELGRRAVDAWPESDPGAVKSLSILAGAYRARYLRDGSLPDLIRATELAEAAVAGTPEEWPDRASMLANLGGLYEEWLAHPHTVADVDRAIHLLEQAASAFPENHFRAAGVCSRVSRSHIGNGSRTPPNYPMWTVRSRAASGVSPGSATIIPAAGSTWPISENSTSCDSSAPAGRQTSTARSRSSSRPWPPSRLASPGARPT
jgi:tetratricopeptide (TPR) repeat protein